MTYKNAKPGLIDCPSCKGRLSPVWYATKGMGVHARLYGFGYCADEGKMFKLTATEIKME